MQEKLAVNERGITCFTTTKTSKNCLQKEMFCIFIFGIDHILIFSNKKNVFLGTEFFFKKKKKNKEGVNIHM